MKQIWKIFGSDEIFVVENGTIIQSDPMVSEGERDSTLPAGGMVERYPGGRYL